MKPSKLLHQIETKHLKLKDEHSGFSVRKREHEGQRQLTSLISQHSASQDRLSGDRHKITENITFFFFYLSAYQVFSVANVE